MNTATSFLALGRLPAGVMNKTERQHADNLSSMVACREVIWYGFEVVKFMIGERCWYSPDFMVQLSDRTMEIHEVKGGYVRDDAMVKLKAAAHIYPQFRFVMMQKTRHGWERREIKS